MFCKVCSAKYVLIFKLTRCIGTPVALAYRFTMKANKISHSMVFWSSPVAQGYLIKRTLKRDQILKKQDLEGS